MIPSLEDPRLAPTPPQATSTPCHLDGIDITIPPRLNRQQTPRRKKKVCGCVTGRLGGSQWPAAVSFSGYAHVVFTVTSIFCSPYPSSVRGTNCIPGPEVIRPRGLGIRGPAVGHLGGGLLHSVRARGGWVVCGISPRLIELFHPRCSGRCRLPSAFVTRHAVPLGMLRDSGREF